jgi:hypothetical protein
MTTKKTPQELLLDWSRASFADLGRDQLKQAAEMLGVEFAPQTNNDTLRKKLCEAIGTVDSTLDAPTVSLIRQEVPSGPKFSLQTTPPNLGPSGRWGGRYRRVRLVRTDYYKNFNAFPISWEGALKYFHFDAEIDMPWPYFEALRNMRETTITKVLSADGRSAETRTVTNQVLPFSDLGDTPGTENLPASMVEYVQRVAAAHDNFAATARRDLVRIMRWLHGPQANVTTKDQTDDEIRDDLLTFIGVDIYAEEAA